MEQQLKQLIESSNSIVITSHIGPDGDSISSSLLLWKFLTHNYGNKNITVAMEEAASSLAFIDGYDQIEFGDLTSSLNAHKPDLVIILDANNIGRISRNPDKCYDFLEESGVKLAIIDHHEPTDKDESDIYINQKSPAVAQDIYEIFIEKLGLQKPDGYAQTAIVGIYTDTGGFIYRNLDYRKTFMIVSKLLEDGANLEVVVNRLNQISQPALRVLSELVANTANSGDCTYSFLSDEFIEQSAGNDWVEYIREGADLYRNVLLRNIEGRPWGFVVYRDLLADERLYSVSFRAISGTKNVQEIAVKLGGGGHTPAAGAKIQTNSVEQAIQAVKEAAGLVK